MASNLQLRIAHLEPQTLTIGKDTRVAALEFCVHGIVVHLRLGLFANHVDDAVMVPVPSSQRIMCSIPTGKHVRAQGLFSVRVATGLSVLSLPRVWSGSQASIAP